MKLLKSFSFVILFFSSITAWAQCSNYITGNYIGSSTCAVMGTSGCAIIISSTSVQDSIIITNPWCLNQPLYAIVDCDSQLIKFHPQQLGSYTIDSGGGSYWTDSLIHLSLYFNATDTLGAFEYCTGSWFSQFHYTNAPLILKSAINLFPNPAVDLLNVEHAGNLISGFTVENILSENILDVKSSESIDRINISSLPTGYYFLKVKMRNGDIEFQKFIKE